MGTKNTSNVGSNASDEPGHNWVLCPHRSVGEKASDDGSSAPDGRRMTGAGADDVASETEGMTVSKGWHEAKHFGAKNQFRAVRCSDMCWRQPNRTDILLSYTVVRECATEVVTY